MTCNVCLVFANQNANFNQINLEIYKELFVLCLEICILHSASGRTGFAKSKVIEVIVSAKRLETRTELSQCMNPKEG